MKILLHSGPGLISRLIKWQTRSEWNHASLLFDDDCVIEAREFRGVRKIHVEDIRQAVARTRGLRVSVYGFREPLTESQKICARIFADEQIGLPYDYTDIIGFLSRRRQQENAAWFCSELVASTCRRIGVPLFRDTESWEVAPGMLARSNELCHIGEVLPL